MKHYIIVSLLGVLLLGNTFAAEGSSSCSSTEISQEAIICCDLHDVLTKSTGIWSNVTTTLNAFPLWYRLKYALLPTHHMVSFINLIQKEARNRTQSWERSADVIAQKVAQWETKTSVYDVQNEEQKKIHDIFFKALISFAACHKVMPQTWNILKKLKAQGHKVYLFTDAGPEVMALHEQTLKNDNQFDLELFDGMFFADSSNNYSTKRTAMRYDSVLERLKASNSGTLSQKLYLIDDSTKKLALAAQHGFTGIQFTKSELLEQQLKEHALL